MSYDPRALGALCDKCPLNGRKPVPPEANPGATVAVIGEAPGENEEIVGRPFVGKSGEELDKALKLSGLHRSRTHITNVLACRPPGNDLKAFLRKIKKGATDEDGVMAGVAAEFEAAQWRSGELISPIECCTPRLKKEVSGFRHFITLGKTASQALTGSTSNILAIRGGLLTLNETEWSPEWKVMPTIHPAFVLRQRRWAHVFRNDVFKAYKWFRGVAEWVPPKIYFNPSVDELSAFFGRDQFFTFDLETDGIEPLTCKIRCVGIGDENEVMLVGLLGKDGLRKFYTDSEERKVVELLKSFFEDGSKVKVGHNAGSYDYQVLRCQWGINTKPILDTILLHKSVESELPHNLGYVGSLYTEAPAWKTDRDGNKLSTSSETDEELQEYCSLDVCVTARVFPVLVDQVKLRDQVHIWQLDQRIQRICTDMHATGMYVDQPTRLEEEKRLLGLRYQVLKDVRDRVSLKDFNPGSVYQVRDLLFDMWKLDVPLDDKDRLTSTDEPSTADIVLRSLLTSHDVPNDKREIIKLIRKYRKVQKILGTYVVKVRFQDVEADLGWDDDDDWVDQETRKKYGQKKCGIADPVSGRMYPGWNAASAVTGRLAGSKPMSAMNVPMALRRMFRAQDGHLLVGADMNQLELRVAAAQWRVEIYLRAFEEGKDPYSLTAFSIFGDRFCQAAGIEPEQFEKPGPLIGKCYKEGKFEGKGEAKNLRHLAKVVQLGSQYMAGVETVHKVIQATELEEKDGTTSLPYARLPMRNTRSMHANWLRGAPEFKRGWDREIGEYRIQGYLLDPVMGRRRDFLDGEEEVNAICNFKIQSGAAALMNKAMIELSEAIPMHMWGPGTGIINQCHDSMVVECPADKAEAVAALMEECMNQTHPALPGVKFSAKALIGQTWDVV